MKGIVFDWSLGMARRLVWRIKIGKYKLEIFTL